MEEGGGDGPGEGCVLIVNNPYSKKKKKISISISVEEEEGRGRGEDAPTPRVCCPLETRECRGEVGEEVPRHIDIDRTYITAYNRVILD